VLSGRLAAHSTPILIDGEPGVAATIQGRVSIMAFDIDGDRIVGLAVLADPKRLAGLGVQGVWTEAAGDRMPRRRRCP
jgi:RNA polymerase sigma-70 factor (ECF subfamily)